MLQIDAIDDKKKKKKHVKDNSRNDAARFHCCTTNMAALHSDLSPSLQRVLPWLTMKHKSGNNVNEVKQNTAGPRLMSEFRPYGVRQFDFQFVGQGRHKLTIPCNLFKIYIPLLIILQLHGERKQ